MKNLFLLCALFLVACSSDAEKNSPKNNGIVIVVIGECNGVEIDGDELCDGKNLGDQTCESQGFGAGELRCATSCTEFDVSTCGAPESCDGDEIDDGEKCDGADLGGETCVTQGYGEGELTCKTNCSGFEIRGCGAPATCGNGQLDEGEVCDGRNFGGVSCSSLDLGDGAISCFENCLGLDTSICEIPLVCEPECPGTLTCERGVCVGPLDGLILNEVGFNVSGKIQVEGNTPSSGNWCTGDDRSSPTDELAVISFVEKTVGYRADVIVTCADNFAYQTRLPIGTFEVRVRRGSYADIAELNLFPVDYLANGSLKVDKTISNQTLNEVGFNVSGKIQVEGNTPSSGNWCTGDDRSSPTDELAVISFVEKTVGYRADVIVTCADNFAYQTRLPIGTYEVRVRRGSYADIAELNLFPVDYLANGSLKVDKTISNQTLNEVGFNVSGKIQVEGNTPSSGNWCTGDDRSSPTDELAVISFVEKTVGYRADVIVTCGDNFAYQTRLPIGTYEVRVRRGSYADIAELNLFLVDYLAAASLKVDKTISNQTLNEVGFNVSGKIQVEGTKPVSGTWCTGDDRSSPTDELAVVSFVEKALGYRASILVTCADNFTYQTRLPIGTYEVRVRRGSYADIAELNLFPVDYLAASSLKVDKTISNQILDEVGFNVSGKIQVEGKKPVSGNWCTGDDRSSPTDELAVISFVEKTLGYRANILVTCGDNFAYQTRLPIGTYEVRVRRGSYADIAELNLFPVDYLAVGSLKVDETISNQTLNEVGFNVSGKIQVEGRNPVSGTWCAGDDRSSPTDELAIVSFVEKTFGYRADILITCADAFSFQTRLPIGIYEVRVRRGSYADIAELNLLPVDYLAIHRLAVQ